MDFSPSDGELSTAQKIRGSQVIIPKNVGVLFVHFSVQGKNIPMAETVYRHFLSKDKIEKMKLPAMMIIQNGINIFLDYLWYCRSSFRCS